LFGEVPNKDKIHCEPPSKGLKAILDANKGTCPVTEKFFLGKCRSCGAWDVANKKQTECVKGPEPSCSEDQIITRQGCFHCYMGYTPSDDQSECVPKTLSFAPKTMKWAPRIDRT
jgi:hypothetical protein